MVPDLISLAGGLVVLLIAGDALVRGAVGLAVKFGVPPMVTGLTIVAFGTSAPELLVSLDSALQGVGGIAMGNVVGSNIANVLLVLGLASIFLATNCDEKGASRNTGVMMIVTGAFIALAMFDTIDRVMGIALLALLALFLLDQYRAAMAHRRETGGDGPGISELDDAPSSMLVAVGLTLAGLVGLPLGAHFTVEGAVATAKLLGVSDTTIGLTIIAIGTSLPELSATLMAAIRGRQSVALGNVIGSNIFNLLAIIGLTAVVIPIPVPREIQIFDLWVMLGAAVFLTICARQRWTIGRGIGVVMTALYIGYIVMVAMFGSG